MSPLALLNGHSQSTAHQRTGRKAAVPIQTREASLVQVEEATSGVHRHSVDSPRGTSVVLVGHGHTLAAGVLVGCRPRGGDEGGEVGEDVDELCVLRAEVSGRSGALGIQRRPKGRSHAEYSPGWCTNLLEQGPGRECAATKVGDGEGLVQVGVGV